MEQVEVCNFEFPDSAFNFPARQQTAEEAEQWKQQFLADPEIQKAIQEMEQHNREREIARRNRPKIQPDAYRARIQSNPDDETMVRAQASFEEDPTIEKLWDRNIDFMEAIIEARRPHYEEFAQKISQLATSAEVVNTNWMFPEAQFYAPLNSIPQIAELSRVKVIEILDVVDE